ncbi:MAG: copper-containing nitrite reductase [bacterium]
MAAAAIMLTLVALAATACSGSSEANAEVYQEPLSPPPVVPVAEPFGRHTVVVNLTAVEQTVEIAPGVSYETWTFNGTVPGPILRARVGDTVEVHLKNPATNTQSHSIDLHAVNGPGGGAGATSVAPGEEKSFTFKAKSAGLFVYHCASGIVADHIANGMYGAILIDPITALSRVDHEYYVGQSEFYTAGDTNVKGMQDMDMTKLVHEQPPYIVFNGNTKSLIGDNALQAKAGETVRIYFSNGGPNLTSSFHVIGEIMDKVWPSGSLETSPEIGLQTVSVAPGNAVIAQFKVDVPGDYKLVDHAIIRVSEGAVGILHVTGANDASTFNVLPTAPGTGPANTRATPTSATVAPTVATGTGAAGALTEVMTDNVFGTKTFTVSLGQAVTFDLVNSGKVIHNMRIADTKGSFDSGQSVVSNPELVPAGKNGTLTWTPTTAGTYNFRCDVHPDQMTGTITVK